MNDFDKGDGWQNMADAARDRFSIHFSSVCFGRIWCVLLFREVIDA